jgi:hypothetical protein
MIIATLIAFDSEGNVTHQDTRQYPDLLLIWEHAGCQQNNRATIRVNVQTDIGVEFEMRFSPWTPARKFEPSERFHRFLQNWGAQFAE